MTNPEKSNFGPESMESDAEDRRQAWEEFIEEALRNPIYLDPDIDINDLIDEMYNPLLERLGIPTETDEFSEVPEE